MQDPGFHERVLPVDLARHVDALWISTNDATRDERSTILPDGCVEVVISLTGGFRLAGEPGGSSLVRVIGLATGRLETVHTAYSLLVGVRLTPAGALRCLGDGLAGLSNRSADGADLLPALAPRLADAAEVLATSGRTEAFERVLRATFEDACATDPRVEEALARLHASRGLSRVDTLARELGISTRQLDRWCAAWLGVSPKRLTRIARFRHAFDAGMRDRAGWARVAALSGYADQAHLSREFVEFCGQPPERIRAALAGGGV
jgi:AraC-like DNA-binding protein